MDARDRAVQLFGDADQDLLRRFLDFHNNNPIVYQMFYYYAELARRAGLKRISHWMLMNRIRWHTEVETTGFKFKISNDFIAFYARLVVFKHPEFEGLFDLKKMRQERKKVVRKKAA